MKSLLIIFLTLHSFCSYCQEKTDNSAGAEPVFHDGIYLSFQQFQSGIPGITSSQLQIKKDKLISIRQWYKSDSLFYINTIGKVNTIRPDSIFAFVDDKDLYIQRNGFGHKVSIIGSLCYFTETYPVRNAPMSPVTIDRSKDIIPRMLDLKTGKLLPYSTVSMEDFLKENDEVLYNEFISLETPKQKRHLLIRYVEKFNERHPYNAFNRL